MMHDHSHEQMNGKIHRRTRVHAMLISSLRRFLSRIPSNLSTCPRIFSSIDHAPSVRTPEQEKAYKLEYESMLTLTEQVLTRSNFQSSDIRSLKLAFNYWTTVRAHQRLRDDIKSPIEQQGAHAARLFHAIMERGDPAVIQEVVKTEEHPMGGLIYLIERLLVAFRNTPQLNMIHRRNQENPHRDDLLNSLRQATSVLSTMAKLHGNPTFPGIPYDKLTIDLMEINLWSKRAWFLEQFGDNQLTVNDISSAFANQSTVARCITAMSRLVEDMLRDDTAPLMQLYTKLITAWVHSGLPHSIDVVLDLLNEMEEDIRIRTLNSNPYNAVMYLFTKQLDDVHMADALWLHMRAPDSGVEPDATTIATYLLALINCSELDRAILTVKEIEQERGALFERLNTICYNVLLYGLAKAERSDAANQAENLLHSMIEFSESGLNPGVAPDQISYSTVMEIFSHQKPGKVEDILVHCKALAAKNKALEPDRIMYNITLNSYAPETDDTKVDSHYNNSVSAAERAETLLRAMETNPDSRPNTSSYNAVLKVFANSGVKFDRVQALFQEMKDKYLAGDATVKPDIFTYNTFMSVLARENVEKATALFDEMQLSDTRPDIITFNTLMNAIIRSVNPGAIQTAERMLEKMESNYASGGIRPDISSYNTVLNAYAKVGSTASVQRSEKLLQRMWALSREENRSDCTPDYISYASIMDGYARSGCWNAGFQAEALLNSMEELDVATNTICYNSALNCWAKSSHIDAPFRAELLRKRMETAAKTNHKVKPNAVTYTTLINCWAQTDVDGAAERASEILEEMELLARNGVGVMAPSAYAYCGVISAWGKVGRVDVVLDILNRAEQGYTSGNSKPRVNFACYNATINAIAKSKRANKAEEAVAILHRLKLQYSKYKHSDLAPNARTYSAVLNACAYSLSDNESEKLHAFQIARDTFQEMLNSIEPTPQCYLNFLVACERLLPPGEERHAIINSLFLECKRHGFLNRLLLSRFERAMRKGPNLMAPRA